MRDVAIIGVGQTKFGKFPDVDADFLALDSVKSAVSDAGIGYKDIQAAYTARLLNSECPTQSILKRVGITGIEMVNVENACAGGATAVRSLWKDIAYGVHDIGIAIGVESFSRSSEVGKLQGGSEEDFDSQLGLSMPALYAMIAKRMMIEQGATPEDIARVSVKNRYHGSFNPNAQYGKQTTIEEVLGSRMICDPITMFQCCPNSDGAAAVILCSAEVARRYTTNPIFIKGSSLLSADYLFRQASLGDSPVTRAAANTAYEMSGVSPKDVDVVELHDAFAVEELFLYESLGLCPKGGSIEMLRNGDTTLGGRVPVNPSGGLLSLGHPLSASGVRVIGDIALQLRGDQKGNQVDGAKVGLAHMIGGAVSGLEAAACSVHILTK